jgi:glycosyltransferase involved in cell wall biosynthesis
VRQAAIGSEVALLCLNQRSLLADAGQIEAARRALSEVCASVEILSIPSDRKRWARGRRLFWSSVAGRSYDDLWFDSPEFAARFRKTLAEFQPDVVHFDTVGLAPYATAAAHLPCILNHHNIESQMMQRRSELERSRLVRSLLRLQSRRLARLERRTAGSFTAHLTVSDLDRDRLLSLIPEARVAVIPNGVDLDFFQPAPPDRPFVPHSIVFAGGLSWYPNRKAVDWLLSEILPRLRARYPDTTATIIGRNPPAAFLDAASRDPALTFTGFLDDIRPTVARAAVYACPIFDGGGTRLKILDTLAQQVPLVATSMAVEGVGVHSERHALLADDADGFSAAVARLFDDPALGTRLAAAGRSLVEQRYGWDLIGARLREVYRSVLANLASPSRSPDGGASQALPS